MKEKALEFATKAHEGQVRKGSKVPYITHPVSVAELVEKFGGSEQAQVAALLHDTIEDTEVTFEELREEFGYDIALMVIRVSEDKDAGKWYNRKMSYIERLTADDTPYESLLVAAADKLHNLTSTYEHWKEVGDECYNVFNANKQSQSWLYREMSDIFHRYGLKIQARKIDDMLDKMGL